MARSVLVIKTAAVLIAGSIATIRMKEVTLILPQKKSCLLFLIHLLSMMKQYNLNLYHWFRLTTITAILLHKIPN